MGQITAIYLFSPPTGEDSSAQINPVPITSFPGSRSSGRWNQSRENGGRRRGGVAETSYGLGIDHGQAAPPAP